MNYIYVALPNAEMEVINGKDDALVGWKQIQGNNWTVAALLTPESSDGVIFAAGFISGTGWPVTDEELTLICGASEDCSFLIAVEGYMWASHSTSTLGSEQVESVSSFPVYESILSLCMSYICDWFLLGVEELLLPKEHLAVGGNGGKLIYFSQRLNDSWVRLFHLYF